MVYSLIIITFWLIATLIEADDLRNYLRIVKIMIDKIQDSLYCHDQSGYVTNEVMLRLKPSGVKSEKEASQIFMLTVR